MISGEDISLSGVGTESGDVCCPTGWRSAPWKSAGIADTVPGPTPL
jgi:hypothetical protein